MKHAVQTASVKFKCNNVQINHWKISITASFNKKIPTDRFTAPKPSLWSKLKLPCVWRLITELKLNVIKFLICLSFVCLLTQFGKLLNFGKTRKSCHPHIPSSPAPNKSYHNSTVPFPIGYIRCDLDRFPACLSPGRKPPIF